MAYGMDRCMHALLTASASLFKMEIYVNWSVSHCADCRILEDPTPDNMSAGPNAILITPYPTQFLVPILLGFGFNWALQGTLSLQVYHYCKLFPNDSICLKCLVCGLCAYEWGQTTVATCAIYTVFSPLYDVINVTSLIRFDVFAWLAMLLMPIFTAAAAQSFYAWRIAILSQRRIFASIVLIGVALAFTFGLVGAIPMDPQIILVTSSGDGIDFIKTRFVDSSRGGWVFWGTVVWAICSVIVDAMIVAFMVYSLRRLNTWRGRTDILINRIVTLVIEAGCLTVFAALAVLGTWIHGWFTGSAGLVIPLLILPKLYANAMMTTLNIRAYRQSPSSGVNMQPNNLLDMQLRKSNGHVSESSSVRETDAECGASEETH
ncbi:hypothetical protein DAEQUDRAFT_722960 [Daedalea quercina L-15889]|uniref:DUF6534 domain-containing protein n=1 Tax=Daedalea quercina L-15889 TaxID=1314783 RepID=A0A165SPB6_9APHY|nr:hypothetical protein DAEQUDRAFT_722960 [Daedalea quercina L-15889]